MESAQIVNEKVLVFTDQHLGLKGNSESRLKIVIKVFKDVISYAKQHNIKNVISMGDLFHSRTAIDVNVLNVGYKLISALAKHCHVWLIVGNHDQYMKNTTEINSIKIFQDIPNVTLIAEPLQMEINHQHALLVPWLGDVSKFKKETFDLMLGHFDISSKFIMENFTSANKNVIGNVTEPEIASIIDVVKQNGKILSGHIHTRKEMVVKSRDLVFVGSPYQQTMGDINCKCGFYVIDENNNLAFNEITSAPKHVELTMSKIVKDIDAFDFSVIKGNIIHKTYDIEVSREDDLKITQKILDAGPFEELLPDYEVKCSDSSTAEQAANIELLKKSKLEYISNYINNIDKMVLENDQLDPAELYQILEKYYNEVA